MQLGLRNMGSPLCRSGVHRHGQSTLRFPVYLFSQRQNHKPLSTGFGSSLPSLVSCKAMMSMPYITVSSLNSTTLVVKQSQFHCRIVRRCLFCSGISVMRSTAAGWLVALGTDAQKWQVHASAALNLCRASWVSLAHFTWNCCRHATQTRGL